MYLQLLLQELQSTSRAQKQFKYTAEAVGKLHLKHFLVSDAE